MKKDLLVVIAGPTAVGKSGIAAELGRRTGASYIRSVPLIAK